MSLSQSVEGDTSRIMQANAEAFQLYGVDASKMLEIGEEMLNISQEIQYKRGVASSYNTMALAQMSLAEYEKAIETFLLALDIYQEIDAQKFISSIFNNMGVVYYYIGDHDHSLEFHLRALSSREIMEDSVGVAKSLNNIGIAYRNLGQLNKARNYYVRALAIKQQLGDSLGISNTLNNVGNIYLEENDFIKAQDYFKQSLLLDSIGQKGGGMATSYMNLGAISIHLRQFALAEKQLKRAIALSETHHARQTKILVYQRMSELFELKNDFEKAFLWSQKWILLKDSLDKLANSRAINELESKYESEKNQIENDLLKEQEKLKDKQIEQQDVLLGMSSVVIILFVMFTYYFMRSYRFKRKSLNIQTEKNSEILKQNELVRKQKEELLRTNNHLDTFFQSSSDLIFELDENSKYLYANKTVQKLLGHSISELKEKSCWDFVPDKYLDSTKEYYINHVKKQQKSSYYEYPIRTKSGELVWLGQSVDYSYDKGKAIHAYAIAKDITKIKKAEERQIKYQEGLRLLNDLGSRSSNDLSTLLMDGLKLCTEYLSLDLGIVSKIEEKDYSIVQFYPSDAGLETGQQFELGGTYCDITIKAKKPISIDEMSSSEYNAHPCFENFKLESYLGAAYFVNGKVRGTINFTSPNVRKRFFTDYDLDFITLVARWIGTLIENDEAQKKMEEEQSILEAFVSSAPASIAMMDKEVKYLAASEKWTKDYSINQEVIGKSHYDIFPEIGDDWKELHQRAINGETLSCAEDPFERADGGIQWIKWEIKPWYKLDKEIGGFIMLTEDVTHVRQQREDLLVAKEDQDNLIAVIAHDLKAPFGQIVGLSDLIANEVNEEGQAINKMIKKISSDSLNMIEDLVQLKYWEKSGAELSFTEFNLQSFHETKMKSFLERAENKKIALRGSTSIDKDLINSDEGLFGRIVDNLLSNAIKFSPKNGMVSFHLSSKENKVELTIEDNGEGFSKSDKEKAFQKFQKLSTQPTGGESSSGLGLSIVHTLVEQLGGTITLESEKGKGAKFTVELPF